MKAPSSGLEALKSSKVLQGSLTLGLLRCPTQKNQIDKNSKRRSQNLRIKKTKFHQKVITVSIEALKKLNGLLPIPGKTIYVN